MKKKLLFLFYFTLASGLLFSQPKKTFFDNWYFGLNVGPTIFMGDVTQNYKTLKTDFTASNIAFGLMLTKEINCVFSLRGQLMFGYTSGSKDIYKGGAPANLSFESRFFNYNLNAKVDFIDIFDGGKCDRKFNFYGFVGIGFIDFQSKLFKSGKEINSWGYGRTGTYKWVTEISIPYGLGIDFRLGKRIKVNLDFEVIWIDGEKMDRTVGEYAHDAFFYPNLGISYNISKYNRVCCPGKDIIPILAIDSTVNKQLNKMDELMAKTDELNKQFEGFKNQLNNLKKDTVYIVKVDTVYNTKVKQIMEKAGYLWFNVYFDVDKYNIKSEYNGIIATVAEIMRKEPDLKIKIVGSADQQGAYEYNDILSKNRAIAVMNVLVKKHNIDPNRLIIDFKGKREPISQIHFEVNRRVDFIKIEK